MSFFSFTTNKKEEISIVLDIGSGTLGCALVKLSKQHAPQILFTHREPIVCKRNISSSELTQVMLRTLETVCEVVLKQGVAQVKAKHPGPYKISRLFYVFSSPWVFSQTKVITVKKDREVPVTHELIDSAIKSQEQRFEKIFENGNYSENFDFDLDVIERNVVQVNLNGYATHNPFGKYAHKIEIPLFLSIVSKKIVEKIDTVVSKYFSYNLRTSHSCILLSCLTLRDLFHAEKDFIFVDVHGELTDIGVIKEGVLVQSSSFPLGINTIYRKVARELKVEQAAAESSVNIFLEGKADNKVAETMSGLLQKIQTEWVDLFHEALEEINKETLIPHKMFLIVGGQLEHFFVDFIKEEKFMLSMVTEQFEIIPVRSNKLFDSLDTYLAIQSIALSKFGKREKSVL